MLRDVAVQRVSDALGFRPSGHSLEATIVLRFQEAQRDLENGKTLPKFLLQEDFPFTLAQGAHTVTLPTGFIRLDWDNLPHYTNQDTFLPTYIEHVRSYSDAVLRVITLQRPGEPAQTVLAPRVFVVRKTVIDFITTADRAYDLAMNYYKAGTLLTSNVENEWLNSVTGAPEWLIGEAGYRIAADARDMDAVKLFDGMRTQGRAAAFGELLADDDAGSALVMGSTN